MAMVFTKYTKKQIVYYHSQRLRPSKIVGALESEGITASKSGVWRFLKRYEEVNTIERKRGSGRPSIINEDLYR